MIALCSRLFHFLARLTRQQPVACQQMLQHLMWVRAFLMAHMDLDGTI